MIDTSTARRDALLPWLRLTLTPGLGLAAQKALLRVYRTPQAVLAAHRDELRAGVGEAAAGALRRGPSTALVDATLRWLESARHHVLTWEDARYPQRLREIPDAPLVLYAAGRIELLASPCVAIVGSRSATPQGRHDAQNFGRALSAAGLTIVSGLALGIDAAAHRGGLCGEASSIAVVGTGLDVTYPQANHALAEALAEKGCLVSEFALGTPPLGWNFPRRNRLISGMSLGVLVIEASGQSGSLATASCALAQGREVFAVPGSIHSAVSKGCHKLIREGATLVEGVEDILAVLDWRRSVASGAAPASPGGEHALLQAMGFGPVSIDQIAVHTGMHAAELAAALSRLEVEGLVASLPGGKYQRAAV